MDPMTQEEMQVCLRVLRHLSEDPSYLAQVSPEDRILLMKTAGKLAHPTLEDQRKIARQARKLRREKRRIRDREARSSAGIREARQTPVFTAPKQITTEIQERPELSEPRNCYVCKVLYTRVHFFYDSMCQSCGNLNYQKRFQTATLEGRTALVTGGRVKIGYHTALKLLRAGARTIVSTRFPQDAALRFSREEDFESWKHRLQIHGLDLRHSPSVEMFARYLVNTEERLDFLINNAAQTVRKPPGFYKHLMDWESKPVKDLPVPLQPLLKAQVSTQLSRLSYHVDDASEFFPEGKLDADLQQVDLRDVNSWRLSLAEVSTSEMLEVHLINAVAPFILAARLKELMLRHPTGDQHIVNASAMEGKFNRWTKTDKHPHTNMAKAALNMLTLTSAADYAKSGIYMNAVDTGWITDEDPAHLSRAKKEMHDFEPPLDIVDGAARLLDPVFTSLLTGEHLFGKFLKDYQPTEW